MNHFKRIIIIAPAIIPKEAAHYRKEGICPKTNAASKIEKIE
jgi:hypothetical protein